MDLSTDIKGGESFLEAAVGVGIVGTVGAKTVLLLANYVSRIDFPDIIEIAYWLSYGGYVQ